MEFTDSGSQSMDSPPREIKMMDAVAVVSGDIRYEEKDAQSTVSLLSLW